MSDADHRPPRGHRCWWASWPPWPSASPTPSSPAATRSRRAGRALGRLGRVHQRVRRADGRAAGAAADLGRTARRAPAREVGRSVRQALYLRLAIAVGVVACCSRRAAASHRGAPALQGEVKQYLGVLALALPPALLFRIYSTLNQSLGKPLLVTWLQLGVAGAEGAAVDLVHLRRRWACRRMGAVGCAWATVVVNYLLLGWRSGHAHRSLYRPYAIWRPHGAAALAPPSGSSRGSASRPACRSWWRSRRSR
jgi:hypothetical protein